MDGYLSKPIQPQELFKTIDRVLEPGSETEVGPQPAPPEMPAADEALDRDELMHRVEGDVSLLRELVGVYLDTCPGMLAELRRAVSRRDAPAVQRAAHTLKGMVGQLGARAAVAAAQRLEEMGRDRDLSRAEPACA